MYLAIVGSRDYHNLENIRRYLLLHLGEEDRLISGGARGVDSFAAEVAVSMGRETVIYPADWENNGKSAGFIRNKLIVSFANKVVAFWDGKSRGTAHSIGLALQAGKLLAIFPDVELFFRKEIKHP